jgi:hypothetical protein
MDLPVSVANKRLTTELNSLDATLTKNRRRLLTGSEAGSSQLDFNRAKGAVFPESPVTSHQSLAGRILQAAFEGVPHV